MSSAPSLAGILIAPSPACSGSCVLQQAVSDARHALTPCCCAGRGLHHHPRQHLLSCAYASAAPVCPCLPPPPQGLTLHVIGNVGTGHGAGVECGIKGVSVAIYNAAQVSPYDPTALNYTKYIDLTNADAAGTFKWSTNRTGALYIDIGVAPDAYPRFANSTYHWLRVKLHADYTGYSASATTGRCVGLRVGGLQLGDSLAWLSTNSQQPRCALIPLTAMTL